MIRIHRVMVVGTTLFLGVTPLLHARPIHKQALADYFGPFLAKPLNDCRTCHVPPKPGASDDALAEDKPHNPFGARLKAVRKELRDTGKKITIATRLEAVAEEDSDGDGVSNLIELLTGHNPGDAGDKPTAAEVAGADKTLAAFRKAKAAYPWTPFETAQRPPVPQVKNAGWVRNPIDAFLAAEHEQRGLTPRPEASRTVLLRRVYLDLTGLPPTPEELHAFLNDASPDAYEKVVDRLLASPRHGERWGRHWMDVWRYSDWAGWTDGKQIRDSQPHIWRWRDWIVESLNADKGYDRMVLEMLAGDELAPEDPQVLRATGYLARNFKLLSREKWMQDVVDHTAQAFLGVTLGCARCHDHLFDPITQKEYYQLRAIFEPHQVRLDRVPGQLDTAKDGLARAYDANLEVNTFLFLRGDDRTPDKTPLAPGLPEVLGGPLVIEPVKLPATAYVPDKRPFVIEEQRAPLQAAVHQARKEVETALRPAWSAVPHLLSGDPMVHFEQWDTLGPLYRLHRSSLQLALAEARLTAFAAVIDAERVEDEGKKGTPAWEVVARRAASVQQEVMALEAKVEGFSKLNSNLPLLPKKAAAKGKPAQPPKEPERPSGTNYVPRKYTTYPATSTGRRLAFARWIADRDNPLTARVAVNHVWLRHFGQALVPTVADFGRNGRPPSHPALLDWLAAEFMERNWCMKQLHRMIVTSSAYRMDSTPDPANLALDRDNKYLWRVVPRRLEAEAVRDCVFYVAGRLDLTAGGPEIDQHQGLTVPRRSIYFRHAQEKQMEFLKLFDAPAVTECYHRKESIQPQQALALANSELARTQGRLLAQGLNGKATDDAAFTTAAFERVLSRSPTEAELAECVAFLRQRAEQYTNSKQPADAALRAREGLVHVLLNHHEFVTVR